MPERRITGALAFGLSTVLIVGISGGALAQGTSPAAPAPTIGPTPFVTVPGEVTLVAYSTPREAYAQAIEAFKATEAGAGVEFQTSFGASGDQSRAVEAGLPADYVAFSLAPDMDRLVKAGIVAPDWDADATRGNVTDSVVVLVVRPDNPKGIAGWDDLVREDVSVITPNPFSSGGARWNIMAAYGAQLKAGRTEAEAVAYLADLFKRVAVQDKSARDALQTFNAGQGDVMLAYENEAITAKLADVPLDYVVPAATILIENPAAVTLNGDAAVPAQAFLDFVHTPDGQAIFGNLGYRPVDPGVLATFDFPTPAQLFTIDDPSLGGWTAVTSTFFDKETGIVAEIERGIGVQP